MIDQKLHRGQDASGGNADGGAGTFLTSPDGQPLIPFGTDGLFQDADPNGAQAAKYQRIASFLAGKIAGTGNLAGVSPAVTMSNAPTIITHGSGGTAATSQIALGANVATSLYGVTGAGLKIGIISDSYDKKGGAAADVASGALPNNVTVLHDQGSGGGDEGRAMIETAYQIASGAQYYFYSGDTGLAAAVAGLQAAGCNVIIDDLSFSNDSIYQVGSAGDNAINTAVANGIDYFTSAGNNGNAYYEQGFAPLTTTIGGINGGDSSIFNDFGGDTPYLNVTIAAGRSASAIFGWAQPSLSISGGDGAGNSLAVYLLDSSGNVVATGNTDQLNGDARQSFSYTNNTANTSFRVVVVQNGGVVPAGELFKFIWNDVAATINNPNAGKGSGTLIGQEFLPGVNVVGAVNYAYTPVYGTSATLESYSSVGPGKILYDGNGNLLATPIVPNEPQFSATDGTTVAGANSGFAGNPFNGTSQAAPNAGAVSALVLSANATLSTTQITSVLAQSAVPAASPNGYSGAGLIQARAAVEIGANYKGASWKVAASGNWNTIASWSGGAAPTSAQGAILDDNLGTFSGTYTVTVNSGGNVAGSLAIATPAGSSATLLISQGGSLAVGGASGANATAGDFLLSDNGTLNVNGGALSVAGSLNVNNGSLSFSSGVATASNYAQNAGSITVGGGGGTAALTLSDAMGFNEIGGSATVLAGGTVTSTLLALSSSTLTIAGKFTDSGALTTGTNGSAGNIVLQTGGELDIAGTTDLEEISFAGPAVLAFTATDRDVTNSGLNDVVSNFNSAGDIIDLTGFIYNASDTLSYSPDTNGAPGILTVSDASNNAIAELNFAALGSYTLASFALSHDTANHLEVIAACYAPGTHIATPSGEVPIETLSIGDRVLTASGEIRPIRWIGRRSYATRFARRNQDVWPVRIRAGALADHVPARDLFVSPLHAVHLDGLLVPANALVNGVSIVQPEPVDRVDYIHIELDTHDVILAENAESETFVDDDSRVMFHNAHEYHALYPDAVRLPALYCAPRVTEGFAVAAIRHRIAVRAGIGAEPAAAKLRGHLDHFDSHVIEGWAQDPDHPEAPVCIDIVVDGVTVAQTLANVSRSDLAQAGLGSGRHGFFVRMPTPLTPQQMRTASVRRSSDRMELLHSPAASRAA